MKTACLLLVLTLGARGIQSAPVQDATTSTETSTTAEASSVPPCEVDFNFFNRIKNNNLKQKTTDVYDQSQNGTDNYKVKVKGFTLLLAPSDALLGAAMMLGGFGEDSLVPPTRSNEVPAQRT